MRAAALFALLAVAACDNMYYDDDGAVGYLPVPTGVSYVVEPVGTGGTHPFPAPVAGECERPGEL